MVPFRALFPNMITSAALACGLASLHFSIQGKFENALIAIALSAIFDALDGRAARLLRVSSRFGAVLDSLSDFVSFGVGPAVMLYIWMLRPETGVTATKPVPHTFEPLFMVCVLTYSMCAAMRLARFTSAKPSKKNNPLAARFFTGMPTPAAAGAVLIPVLIDVSATVKWQVPPVAVAIYTLCIGALMVSRRPMYSFKKLAVHRRMVLPLFISVGVLVFIAAKDAWLAGAILAGAYLLTLPLAHLSHARLRQSVNESAQRAGDGANTRPAAPPPALDD
ncbi:MAG TPA: phosphatidylcholine/phosphatidylserine synthase [Phycisphaerales bacterium]